VCVWIALAIKRSNGTGISEASECDAARDDTPFIQFTSGHSRNGARSVFVAIFDPAVRKVVVELGKRTASKSGFRRISKSKAH
jgi:hypothetical protein